MSGSEPGVEPADSLGRCPTCTESISEERLVIRYEPEDGWPTIFATCPACSAFVHPM